MPQFWFTYSLGGPNKRSYKKPIEDIEISRTILQNYIDIWN